MKHLFAITLLIPLSGCASMSSRVGDPYTACGASPHQWSLVPSPPAELAAVWARTFGASDLDRHIWFVGKSHKVLACSPSDITDDYGKPCAPGTSISEQIAGYWILGPSELPACAIGQVVQ